MKKILLFLTMFPFCAFATLITGIKADGDTKVFSLNDVVSIKLDENSNLAVSSKSGNTDGGFKAVMFSEVKSQLSDVKSDLAVKVYPNPVKSVLYLVGADADTKFEIFSTTGNVVMKGEGESVNVSNLSSGQYIIVAGNKSVKFIKE